MGGRFVYFLTKMKLLRGNLINSKSSRNGWGNLTLFDRFVAITCQIGWGRCELVWGNPQLLILCSLTWVSILPLLIFLSTVSWLSCGN